MATKPATGAATGPVFSEWNIIIAGDLSKIYLLAEVPVAAFIVFVAGFLPPFLLAVPLKSSGAVERLPASDGSAFDAGIHDFTDGPCLPVSRFVELVIKGLPVKLLAAYSVAFVGVKEVMPSNSRQRRIQAQSPAHPHCPPLHL